MRYSNKKHGGLRFIRIGRLQFSYSFSKRPAPKLANDAPQSSQASLWLMTAIIYFSSVTNIPIYGSY